MEEENDMSASAQNIQRFSFIFYIAFFIHIALFPLFPVEGSIVCSHQFVRDGAASRHALFIMHHAWNDFSSFFVWVVSHFLTSYYN